MIQEGYKAARV